MKSTIVCPNKIKVKITLVKRFDNDCRLAKCAFFDAISIYNRQKSDENRRNMIRLKQSYKMIVKKKRRAYETNKIRKIEKLRHSKPKDF